MIPQRVVDWVYQCDSIMREYGMVSGEHLQKSRLSARSKARKLIRYLIELRIRDRDELREHYDQVKGGWVWSVELVPKKGDSSDDR
jgi:hypothetical protein